MHLAVTVMKVVKQVGSLLTGVCHIKGIVSCLRVEHQTYLLALMHIAYQLLMLLCSLLFVHGHKGLLLLVFCLQLSLQHTQGAS